MTDVYASLREQILSLDPATAGLERTAGSPLWGVVFETGYPNGSATVICLRDGTTSLYTSGGGGIIGAGAHDAVVRANADLFAATLAQLAEFAPSTDREPPADGQVVIRALTYDGQLTFAAAEDDLGYGLSVLSPVFYAAQEVITQLRLIDEQRPAE
jgi:hypothetical protein